MYASIFRALLLAAAGFLLLSGCDDIPRDNLLDPKNPDSYRAQTILVEAFVNTAHPSEYNDWALEALEQVAANYGDAVLVAEYHRNVAGVVDPYHLDRNEELYQTYTSAFDPSVAGVPDIFINGITARVQGASGVTNVRQRLVNELQKLVSNTCVWTIEADISRSNNSIQVDCRIARLGAASSDPYIVRAVIVENTGTARLHRVVREILVSSQQPALGYGETRLIELGEFNPQNSNPLSVVLLISSPDRLNVWQSTEVSVP